MSVDAAKRALFQDRFIDSAGEAFASRQNVIGEAPTGAGKTYCSVKMIDNWLATQPKGTKAIMVVDRQSLVLQNADSAKTHTSRKTSICLDGKMDQSGDIVFACSDTLRNNIGSFSKYGLAIVDEVHHAGQPAKNDDRADEYSIILDALLKQGALIGGVSATTERSDGRPIHKAFENAKRIVVTMQEAVDAGVILPPRAIPPVNPLLADGRRVQEVVQDHLDIQDPSKTIGGLKKALTDRRPENYFDAAVSAWLRATKDPQTPTFAYVSSKADAKLLVEAFADRGVEALPYHSGLPAKEIKANKAALENGVNPVLVSVKMLDEGVDIPKVRALLICKEVTTRTEWIQINGRAARAQGDKQDYIAIDMGASTYMHGDMTGRRLVEGFGAGQRQSLGEKAFSPWIAVDKDASGKTTVYATHDGKKTVFMARQEQTGEWHAFSKAEVLTGHKRSRHTEITRFPNPANGHSPLRSKAPNSLENLGRALVRAAPNAYATLAFQPAGPSLEAIAKESYEKSSAAIKKYISPVFVHPQLSSSTIPKKVSGAER